MFHLLWNCVFFCGCWGYSLGLLFDPLDKNASGGWRFRRIPHGEWRHPAYGDHETMVGWVHPLKTRALGSTDPSPYYNAISCYIHLYPDISSTSSSNQDHDQRVDTLWGSRDHQAQSIMGIQGRVKLASSDIPFGYNPHTVYSLQMSTVCTVATRIVEGLPSGNQTWAMEKL